MSQGFFRPLLTPQFVAEALKNSVRTATPSLATEAPTPFTSIQTDSRKIAAGCLFVALAGEKFDGHDFIAQAVTQGAGGILCRRDTPVELRKGLHVFFVEDTLDAYRRLAGAWRREFAIPVVAVAGSAGKTTTKEILSAVLHGKFASVLKTRGSQNGFVGIPMTLMELAPDHGAAVIEVGIDEPGAMAQHLPLVAAGVSVLTAIGPEHLEKLIDIPTVAREEGIALSYVTQNGGTAAINLDDPWIRPHFATLRQGKKIAYSLDAANAGANVLVGELADSGDSGETIRVSGFGMNARAFRLPLPGRHNAHNLLAALAIATTLGLTPDEMERGLATFTGAAGRSELRTLNLPAGAIHAVCDYYNAQPLSTAAGLKVLDEVARRHGSAARWACLADMLELGAEEERFHRELAPQIVALGIEHVVLYGKRMQWLADELGKTGYRGTLAHLPTHADIATKLRTELRANDTILIKGSNSMKMEDVWKLLANP